MSESDPTGRLEQEAHIRSIIESLFEPADDVGGLSAAIWSAAVVFVDELIEDCQMLATTADDPDARRAAIRYESVVLDGLPARFHHLLDYRFAARFLISAVELTGRMVRGWWPPRSVAEELALRLLLDQIEAQLEVLDVKTPDRWREALETDWYEDLDHEYLYEPEHDGFEHDSDFGPTGMAPLDFGSWFRPFAHSTEKLHPYLLDEG